MGAYQLLFLSKRKGGKAENSYGHSTLLVRGVVVTLIHIVCPHTALATCLCAWYSGLNGGPLKHMFLLNSSNV
jgi:hypothetical protein